ncbi:uncharacterized protein LOC116342088 [Contarinia nasturtii]|uniref:uncharacterized protein LOC116342088 n=1 Tax=Contarinia nasturtii TaxID=265458 RepID=UPI0012D3F252|nr:uncharacterized protein LOC116342088 [Contarinia nasturtii]
MHFGRLSSISWMKKWLLVIVLFSVITSLWAQPVKVKDGISGFGLRKTCGRDLVARVDRICQSRGGHMTYTDTSRRSRRIRRGIVAECCTNKCADHHLYAYCSNDKYNTKSSESIESPAWPNDILEVADSQVKPILQEVNSGMNAEMITESLPLSDGEVTSENPRYHDVLVNGNVDTKLVDRIIKTLPRNFNEYQVGTVPPEYQLPVSVKMSRYIPSRVRINSNYY